ncbi:MAG TPA: hypothetical protein VN873_05410 [Candidatus Angelobacter sp.]|nr:hypothetical protein [Candidatus Angelobacter sp.]
MSEENPNLKYVPRLDEMLTREQCAAWLQQSERWLWENEDKVVPFKPSHKVILYHPRTVLARMAFDAGVPLQIIAASYGVTETTKKQ